MTPHVRKYIKAALAAWTFFAAFLLFWEFRSHTEEMELLARSEARASWERDTLYRAWAASQSGFYVPLTEATPPNPYLADLPDHDVGTTSGKRRTLIDPAYMTRNVHDLRRERFGPVSHITSLRPVNPANAPDPWERAAFAAFEKGEAEVSSVEPIDGKPHMRLMRPVVSEPGCLKCHEAQGYKAGDILGGISISIPMEPFFALWRAARWNNLLAVGLLWLAGSAIILGGGLRIGRDLDQVFKSEEALRRERDRAQSYLDTVEAIIVALDAEGRITSINRKGCQLLGRSEQDLVGRDWFFYCLPQPEGKERMFPHFLKLMKGDIEPIEYFENRILNGAGEIREIAWHNAMLRDENGRIAGTLGAGEDITERKRAAEALRLQTHAMERERREFQAILDAAPVMIAYKSKDDHFVWVNKVFAEFMELPREKIIGMTTFDLVKPREVAQQGRNHDLEVIRTGIPVQNRLIKWSGFQSQEEKWGLYSKLPISGSDGGIIGTVSFVTDIDARVRAEAEKARLEVQLQQAQKLESLGVMAGGIAHDFNNLLMVVLGHAELALKEIPPISPVRENLTEIETAARRAADLSLQMLAYAGKSVFTAERVELPELVEEMAHLLKSSISKKAVLTLNLEKGLPPIQADPSQIRQIVMNLIINASEAIGEQSGVITVSVGTTRCDEEHVQNAELYGDLAPGLYIQLEVTDTGGGMDEKTRSRIFDPFFTTKFTGRGLGLSAVLGIVRSHKGALKVHSEPGEGTTFKVLFPALEDAGEEAPTNKFSPLADWRGKGTILLVDDEENLIALGARMLEHLGFTVLTAADGLQAVDLYRERGKEIDLVLMDLTMPHMDGAEAFDELRRMNPDVPVVLASGYAEDDVSSRFEGKRPSGIIQKPYTLATLREALSELMPARSTA